MKISKRIERWFVVPDDPDNGEILIRHLSPGDRNEIIDNSFTQKVSYKSDGKGGFIPEMEQGTNPAIDREMTVLKSVAGWKNLFEEDGKTPLEFNTENVKRAMAEIHGFVEVVNSFRAQLRKDVAEEEEARRKNSQGSASKRGK